MDNAETRSLQSSDQPSQGEKRKTFFLGKPGVLVDRNNTPSPGSGENENCSGRDMTTTPLMPQGSLYMTDHQDVINRKQAPSVLECMTLIDAPRVYKETEEDNNDGSSIPGGIVSARSQHAASEQSSVDMTNASKSAYRHHLPRRGQPGCRVITSGVLGWKRSSVPRQMVLCETGMYTLGGGRADFGSNSPKQAKNQQYMQIKINSNGIIHEEQSKPDIVSIDLKQDTQFIVQNGPSTLPNELNPEFLDFVRARAQAQASISGTSTTHELNSSLSPPKHRQMTRGAERVQHRGRPKIHYHRPVNSDLIDDGVANSSKKALMVVGVLQTEQSKQLLQSATQMFTNLNQGVKSGQYHALEGHIASYDANSTGNYNPNAATEVSAKGKRTSMHGEGLDVENPSQSTLHTKTGQKAADGEFTLHKQKILQSGERDFQSHGQKFGSFINARINKSLDSSKGKQNQDMQIKIQETSQLRVKQKMQINQQQPSPIIDKDSAVKQSVENPYNVTSFKNKKKSRASSRGDSQFGKPLKSAMPIEHLTAKSPDIITVAMLDKTSYNKGKVNTNAGNNLILENFINKNPRMTNYELLKRPKTNRIDLDPIGKQLGDTIATTISINDKGIVSTVWGGEGSASQRMMPATTLASGQNPNMPSNFIRSEFQSQQERRVRPNLVQTAIDMQFQSSITIEKSQQKSTKTPIQGFRQHFAGKANRQKHNIARKQRYDSLGMHKTTGEYALKAFANSFQETMPLGGNQLHQTQHCMKQNSVNVQNVNRFKNIHQRPSLHSQIQAVQAKLASKPDVLRQSSAASSVADSTDLFINGNRARPPIIHNGSIGSPLLETYDFVNRGFDRAKPFSIAPFHSVDYHRHQLHDTKTLLNPVLPLSQDTSRSPIPIDPETSRHMMMQLPSNLDTSSCDHMSRNQLVSPAQSLSQISLSHSSKQAQQYHGSKNQVEPLQSPPTLMAMETPQSLIEGDSTELSFVPRIDMLGLPKFCPKVLTTKIEHEVRSASQLSHNRQNITSRQSHQPRLNDNIKEVNYQQLVSIDCTNVAALNINNQSSSIGRNSRQQNQSKMTNRSNNHGVMKKKSSIAESIQDDSMQTSRAEKTRLEQRLFVEGQGKKESKQVTIQTGREEIGQKLRNKRLTAAGRFKSMGDAKEMQAKVPLCDLSVAAFKIGASSQGSSTIDEQCTIIHRHVNATKIKPIHNHTSLETVRSGASTSRDDPSQVQKMQILLLQQQRSQQNEHQNEIASRQSPKHNGQEKQISRPVVETVKIINKISMEKICHETTVILDGRSSDRIGDHTGLGPITPKYTTVEMMEKAGLNSETYVDRFGAGSIAGWQNKSQIGTIGESPQNTVVTEMRMLSEGMSHYTPNDFKGQTTMSLRGVRPLNGGRTSKIHPIENNDIASQLVFKGSESVSPQQEEADYLIDNNVSNIARQQNASFFRIDDHTLQMFQSQDYGIIDFAAQKAREFLIIQDSLPKLDYNTLGSDAESALNLRADNVLKNIALQSKMVAQLERMNVVMANSNLDEINQKRLKMIRHEIPTYMIKFKNKSERERYLRVVKCIIGLPVQGAAQTAQQKQPSMNKTDVEFNYMKIFRFLGDTLSQYEFESLSYYHVASFIQRVIKVISDYEADPSIASRIDKLPDTLRRFVCEALDLRYEQSKLSQDMLAIENERSFNQSASLVKPLWHVNNIGVQLEEQYAPKNYHEPINKLLVKQCAETRHALIHNKIKKEVKSKATEPGLPTVVQNSLARKGQETMHRGNVARLLQVNKRHNDFDFKNLRQESNIARNKVVLEHIVYKRNLKDWRDQVLSELHEEQRNAKSVSTSRRSTRHQFN